ncbi:unnamed protein product, partial [Aphanomyces euteiches]
MASLNTLFSATTGKTTKSTALIQASNKTSSTGVLANSPSFSVASRPCRLTIWTRST